MNRENRAHREYFRTIYPAVWREKVRRYGLTDYHRRIVPFLRSLVPADRSARVLEVAVGTGEPIADGVAPHARFFGIDLARESLEQARQRLPGSFLAEAEAESLPFRDAVFDLAYCLQSSWNMEDVPALVAEMVRVTARGGACVVDLMNMFSPRVMLAHGAMRARSLLVPGLAGYLRERGVNPWRIAAGAPPGTETLLLDARDLSRAASPRTDFLSSRQVLVIRKP